MVPLPGPEEGVRFDWEGEEEYDSMEEREPGPVSPEGVSLEVRGLEMPGAVSPRPGEGWTAMTGAPELPRVVWGHNCRWPQHRLPLIRTVYPRSGIAILFPLNKAGLGTMVSTPAEWDEWTLDPVEREGGVEMQEVEEYTGYPRNYMEAMLAALATDAFPGGDRLSWS